MTNELQNAKNAETKNIAGFVESAFAAFVARNCRRLMGCTKRLGTLTMEAGGAACWLSPNYSIAVCNRAMAVTMFRRAEFQKADSNRKNWKEVFTSLVNAITSRQNCIYICGSYGHKLCCFLWQLLLYVYSIFIKKTYVVYERYVTLHAVLFPSGKFVFFSE